MYSLKTRRYIFPAKQTVKAFIRITLAILFNTFLFFSDQHILQAEIDLTEPLIEVGINYYNDGEYQEALGEFKKALIIDPDNETAKRYIRLIEGSSTEIQRDHLSLGSASNQEKRNIVTNTLDELEQRFFGESVSYAEVQLPASEELKEKVEPVKIASGSSSVAVPQSKEDKRRPYKTIALDETVKLTQPKTNLDLQIGRDLYIQGHNIKRFLIINPEIVEIKKTRSNEVLVVSKKVGTTYFHIWDDEGRWSFIARVSPFKPDRPTLSEIYRRTEEAESFKIRYSNIYTSFNTGRRIDDLERSSYSFYQSLGIDGQTPYGDFDSRVQFDRLNGTNEVTYYTAGLEDGALGPFKGFDVRAFDYYVDFYNMGLGGASLRGAKFHSEAFNNKINYTVFWGRENQGIFSPLAPGFVESRDSYLEGAHLGFGWPDNTYQTFSYFRGYGSARNPTYAEEVYDYTSEIKLGNIRLRADAAYDKETYSYLLNSVYTTKDLSLSAQLRNIEDDFKGVTGRPQASGELGALVACKYNIGPKVEISSRLDVYRDRLFPNPEHERRYNIDFDASFLYTVDPTMNWRFDYSNLHDTGIISPYKNESMAISIYKTLDFIKKLNTFLIARHQTSDNPASTTLDYKNEKVTFGLRFGLTDNLNFFASKEFNWLEEYTGKLSKPHVFEAGADYNKKILETPFYLTSRVFYRDEENATSIRSFLSGEDSLEAQAELRYQPSEDFSAYVNLRVNNIWAENPDTAKRMEGEIRLGSRWIFDTGFRWNPVGSIAGIVFKDLNSDGIYQTDEPTIKGIKISTGEDKFDISDSEGMYLIENIRAKNVSLSIDTDTLPVGFVLTGPSERKVKIEHHKIVNVDFGIVSRSEIYGIVFHDVNGNGEFDSGDIGVGDVVLTLEDGTRTTTNARGQYYFRGIPAGTHKITLGINSLPVDLIPKIPIFKDIVLFEGTTYIHNIPLKEVKK
jgi:tetratricopeptide (TPR) repeat protein